MRDKVAVAIVLLVVLCAVTGSRVDNTTSDPHYSLFVSDAILTYHTIRLDNYRDAIQQDTSHGIYLKNEHYYYFFPLGTSVASVPFVAAAKAFGVRVQDREKIMQMRIAAVVAVLNFLLMLSLARLFMPLGKATVIAAVFWFGSSLASTCGTALWSHDFAVLFAFSAIYLVVKAGRRSEFSGIWLWVSISLFMAYLCRPTMALLAPFVLLFIAFNDKREAVKSAVFLAVLLGGFMMWSQRELHQYLPDYYMPHRLSGGMPEVAFIGNLFSPARGLLVFSPFIWVAWMNYRRAADDMGLHWSWLLIALAWPLLHLWTISNFPHWWGGYSYGSRFMTDALPGLFLLTLKTWPRQGSERGGSIGKVMLATSVIFAIYVNAYQGLFNPYTALWNAEPSVDEHPEYLFDWHYPQFLNSEKRQHERVREYTKANAAGGA